MRLDGRQGGGVVPNLDSLKGMRYGDSTAGSDTASYEGSVPDQLWVLAEDYALDMRTLEWSTYPTKQVLAQEVLRKEDGFLWTVKHCHRVFEGRLHSMITIA